MFGVIDRAAPSDPASNMRRRWNDAHDLIETKEGFVSYSFLERMAICMESGLSEREAMRTASIDYQRELTDTLRKTQPNMEAAPRNSYGEPLPVTTKVR